MDQKGQKWKPFTLQIQIPTEWHLLKKQIQIHPVLLPPHLQLLVIQVEKPLLLSHSGSFLARHCRVTLCVRVTKGIETSLHAVCDFQTDIKDLHFTWIYFSMLEKHKMHNLEAVTSNLLIFRNSLKPNKQNPKQTPSPTLTPQAN